MVSPLYILAIGLGAAFLLGLLRERKTLAYALTLTALAAMSGISALWLHAIGSGASGAVEVFTAGSLPPFAINLRMGLFDAALTLLINLTGLASALYLKDALFAQGQRAMAVLLVMSMALCGIILTRDLFNLFVFFELVVIASGGLVLLTEDARNDAVNAFAAGFKYMLVSQLISIFLLIGIIFAYHATGTLNIDGMASVGLGAGGALAFFMIFIALNAELKPFPANGWALDIYEASHPGFSALFAAASGTAALFAVDKILLIGGAGWLPVATGIGLTTFVAANLLALPQRNDRRLLGYSSIAQTGLVLVVLGQRDILGDLTPFIAGGILLAHAVAKAGLFWLSGWVQSGTQGRDLAHWAALRSQPLWLFAFACFIALLAGLPPFPGFYAKWELIRLLAGADRLWVLGFILFGALLEAGYLFRWFGYALKREPIQELNPQTLHTALPVLLALFAGWVLAFVWGDLAHSLNGRANLLLAWPLVFALAFVALDGLPVWIKNSLAIAGLTAWFALTWPEYDPLRLIFAVIFLLGGALILLASYHAHGRRIGFYPSAMLMFAGLALLIRATDSFDFFAAWELLTLGSYFLILRGQKSEPHALSYLVFSLGGAFLILAAFALAGQGALHFDLDGLKALQAPLAPWVFLLLAIGFMTKTASIGLHIWLPGAHAEAETDVSPMVSGILLKAGLYGMMVLLLTMGAQSLYGVNLVHALLWIGALTALLGNLMAVFQEDAKRLLAYSSIGQMGYALFGLALMNQLGWLMALVFVINHFIYKSMLFLAMGGVAKRTGTREMYRMGGLIKLMPLSFIAVLIGIIAMSGVPPLSGFGGRWVFYNAIMSHESRLPLAIIFLAGPVAFLYLFRLIQTVFLGQLKDEHRHIKEAPFWIVLPQMIMVGLLLAFALVPGLVLRRVDAWLDPYFPGDALNWSGLTITSSYGYWNPLAIMAIVAVIFGVLLASLLYLNRHAQVVKQFNIVFSAERPYRPETTHYAWNFFAPYRRAMGFLTQPFVTRFWAAWVDLLHAAAELMRRLYNGNGQTYLYHFMIFAIAIYALFMGGL